MDVKNLMVEDWVYIENDPTPRQIDWIKSGEVGLFWNKIVTPPHLKPIPITPEILKKNKFVNHQGEYYCTVEKQLAGDGFELMTIIYRESKNRIQILTSTSNIETVCKYVHELQHLLKFCEIEKTIEL